MSGNFRVKLVGKIENAKRVTPKMIKFDLIHHEVTPKGDYYHKVSVAKSDEITTPENMDGCVGVVDGALREHKWKSKDGKDCSSLEVFCFDLEWFQEGAPF